MSTARTWSVPIPRKPVKSRRADPPIEQTWLYRVGSPAKRAEMEAGSTKRRAK